MIYPDSKKTKIKKCCTRKNLFYSYGDGVELEIYSCSICDSDYAVRIEIKRDFDNMELCV